MSDIKSRRSLGEVPIDGKTFEHELRISEGYQAYSTELLRLALIGIGGVGFLIKNLEAAHGQAKAAITASVVFFGLSAASALLHRYVGPDSLSCHLKFLRLAARGAPKDPERARKERAARDRRFRQATALLTCAASLLALAVVSLAASFLILLWC